MDELACLMDWDLEAIVRGCSREAPPGTINIMDDPHQKFSHFCSEHDDELLCSFPEFSETTTVLDELEELYKPFYPVLHPSSTLSSQTIVTSSLPIAIQEPEEVKGLKASDIKVALQDLQVPAVSKCKGSKKNQKKRVMKQVTAVDGICDPWSWRKYGQKPIKGSPYPRSYYRCSTSKGCLARKQVERSHLDPGVFLVAYTAEHSHPHPIRKNSLAAAGSIRKNNNSSVAVAPSSATYEQNTCSSNSTAELVSPRTPLVVVQSIEDDVEPSNFVQVQQRKGLKKGEDFLELLDDAELEELIGLNQQLALDGCGFMDTFAETD